MAFDEHQLDEIRAALKVSDVVGSSVKLIKKGGSEFVAADNQSLTVNDLKGLYYDFGSGNGGGDIFKWMQEKEGLTFVGAVEELAKRAGITVKQRPGRSGVSPSRSNGAGQSHKGLNGVSHDAPPASSDDRIESRVGEPTARTKREIISAWDYVDPENGLLYQTVRMQEKLPDGSWRLTKEGKIWKTFLHRRPVGDGTWILGLDVIDRDKGTPLEFIKTESGTAWLRATEERLQWRNITRRTFAELGNVEHWLYNANSVIDELQEPKEDQRTIYIPEGESKVDVLKEWGLLAVTNSGGAKNFTTACAEFFRGASHVVILQDNDRAGAERVAKIGPMLKEVGVETVQALNFRDVWPACPAKGDIKDWRDQGGGTKDKLLEVVDQLKPWAPEPYKSKFGAKTAIDLIGAAKPYPWRIKFLVPRNVDTLIMGPSRSGKTFEALDMCMHVHFGKPYAGKKVEAGGVVYLTYEGSEGFENRLRAYMLHHGLKHDDLHSFAWLTRPAGLYATEDSVRDVAKEIVEISKNFRLPLSHSVVDTHNSATRGSSEIKSEDLNRIQTNYGIIREITGAPLWVIGHTNAEGRHRGNEQFFNGIEAALLVERVYSEEKKKIEKRDDSGRIIRRLKSEKQREGDDRLRVEFVLELVVIGVDEDGDDITSMVSVEPASNLPSEIADGEVARDRPEGFYLRGSNVDVFTALLKALESVGKPPPPELKLPASVGSVIHWRQLGIEYKKIDPPEQDEDIVKYRNRIKARTRRFREELLRYNVIGIAEMPDPTVTETVDGVEKPKVWHFVWPTGRRVYGKGLQWPVVARKPKGKPSLLAPGETIDDLSKVF